MPTAGAFVYPADGGFLGHAVSVDASEKKLLGRVARAAMAAKPPYVLGSKVLIDRVAGELHTTTAKLAPFLVEWNRTGILRLSRIDLTAAFDSVKGSLRRSFIPQDPDRPDGIHGWHAIDRDSFQ